jgi:hypothetical protein
MQKIKIERYDDPKAIGYQGYVEPEDRSWILYVENDGAPLFYPHRAEDGGVLCEGLGPHNVRRDERGAAAAMAAPVEPVTLLKHLSILLALVDSWQHEGAISLQGSADERMVAMARLARDAARQASAGAVAISCGEIVEKRV